MFIASFSPIHPALTLPWCISFMDPIYRISRSRGRIQDQILQQSHTGHLFLWKICLSDSFFWLKTLLRIYTAYRQGNHQCLWWVSSSICSPALSVLMEVSTLFCVVSCFYRTSIFSNWVYTNLLYSLWFAIGVLSTINDS